MQDKAARHHAQYGPECQSSAFVVDLAVAYAGLVLLVARAMFSVVVGRPEMLGVMAGMHHKDSYALFGPGSGLCKVRFARYGPEEQLVGEKVVVIIPVVAQRVISKSTVAVLG